MRGSVRGRLVRPSILHACARAAALLAALAAGFLLPGPLTLARAATLHQRFDFEQPGYGRAGQAITDHFLLQSGGLWHLFYTELAGPTTPECRIGHAQSTDLIHWTERTTVTTAGGNGWTATGTWAPHVIAKPGGGWQMFFSGRNASGAQAIGALTSSDLETWTPVAGNPLWVPPTWARNDGTSATSCRDPFLWTDGTLYHMLYTAHTLIGRPAIGHATSSNLLSWSDAGAFMIDVDSVTPIDLESPQLVFDNGRVELLYTRFRLRILTATTSAGPWDLAEEVTLDPVGGAAEKLRVGATQLLSRVRFDICDAPTSLIVIDTVTASPDGYLVPGPGVAPGWRTFGEAFERGSTFGDPPAWRGETPAAPLGWRWMGSGEWYRQPADPQAACSGLVNETPIGSLRSPRFTLYGDSLWYRVMGAASLDSAALRLVDACTGLELARRTGANSNALTPGAWPSNGWRGWPVHVELVDLLTRPGGFIGADAIRDSTMGTYTAPTPIAINQTAPAGGEMLAPGESYVIRWTSFSTAGVDSHVVYASYDDFATPPIRLQKRNANQFSWTWTVPSVIAFAVRIRVVAYARNAVHDCDTSPPFAIGLTTDARPPDVVGAAGIALVALGSPGPAPGLEWSAPPGRRIRLELIDVRGRLVRALVAGRTMGAGGRERVTWDGVDERGRRVPPGLYFAALSVDGGPRHTVRLVRLAPGVAAP